MLLSANPLESGGAQELFYLFKYSRVSCLTYWPYAPHKIRSH